MTTTYFDEILKENQKRNGPIVIGLAGAGQMGTDIIVQVSMMPGIQIGAVAEVNPKEAVRALRLAGHKKDDVVEVDKNNQIEKIIGKKKIAVTENVNAMTEVRQIDVVIDATGNPNVGTIIALKAIKNKKHIVMLNVEADITIGRELSKRAKKNGVIYTGAAGDEPACVLEMIGFAKSLGMEIVAAGKGKNNPLKVDAVPKQYLKEAAARDMNARMLVEFIDGSKTAIEMVAVANATGLVPDVPGMHGPKAKLSQIAEVLCPKKDGGILNKKGVVDYSIGKGVAPGVFVVVKPKHPRILERMIDLKVGKGPYFTLHRPYHLTSIEVPLSAARAVINKKPDMVPLDYPVAEAIAIAKRDLKKGQKLGKIGEEDYRGSAVTWEYANKVKCVPIGIAENTVVTKNIKKGQPITYNNSTPDESLEITKIRNKMNQEDNKNKKLGCG